MEAIQLPPKRKTQEDGRFERCEAQIREALCISLMQRQTIKIGDFCKMAHISRTTFYAHHKSYGDALRKYELDLKQNFNERINYNKVGKEVVFTILLSFIYDERMYFSATIPNSNYWLLNEIFTSLRPSLAEVGTDNRRYEFYTQEQIGIICCWVKHGEFSSQEIPGYVKIMSTRDLAQKSNS